jgi:hypothetical protein
MGAAAARGAVFVAARQGDAAGQKRCRASERQQDTCPTGESYA